MYRRILFLLVLLTGTIQAQTTHDFATAVSKEARQTSSDSVVIDYLRQRGIATTTNNASKILPDGKTKFNDLFQSVREAKHHIHMEYFNFRNDSIANALFDLLAIKANEGVQIRLLFDAFGNWSNSKPLKKKDIKAVRAKGIDLRKFDPIKFPYINHVFHRDHRKIVIIDGRIGYTGGMNVADYYIHGLPKIGEWRDMHLRLEGDAVKELQQIFLSIWNKVSKQKIEGEDYFPDIDYSEYPNHHEAIAIVDRIPCVSPKIIRRTYAKSIDAAEHKIQIINPYFVPTKSINKALKKAIDRGVDVEIMISSKSDISFTPDASLYKSWQLSKRGAEVFMYNGGFHHSKIMMIDDAFCTIGSTNLNSRSLRWDYETNAFLFDKGITKQLTTIFEDDKEDSTVLTKAIWKKKSKWKRFTCWFAHLFTPFL
ncbi:cardiolipin synthase [Bacteroides sp. 214]|uniref:cardiolipin synthase n=1 Tax=Bacteroides sp. 214 TaxID=2302935 RepID=UPI0013D5E41B|nr:cardiolipin synthase [Bacteroides sp. 214]